MPHNMVINDCTSVHTYTLKIGHLDGDRFDNFSFENSLGRKFYDHSIVDQELVDKINDLI